MTVQEVRDRVAALVAKHYHPPVGSLESLKDGWWSLDGEAHATADAIYADVLTAIAEGTAEDPAEMARVALAIEEMGFARWYE